MAFIEASTGRRADLVVGKPHTGIVQAALRRTGLAVGQLAMVGDRLYTDIETGLKSGMLSIPCDERRNHAGNARGLPPQARSGL